MKLFFLLFFLSSQSFALSYLKYCCEDSKINQKLQSEISFFLKKSDKIKKDKFCTSILVQGTGEIIIQKLVKKDFPNCKLYNQIDNQESKKHCLFHIIKNTNQNTKQVSFGNKNYADKKNSQSTSTSMLKLIEGTPGYLKVNHEEVSLTCELRGKISQITIRLKDPSNSLQTSLEVIPGKKYEISSVVSNLKDRDKKIDVNNKELKLGKKSQNTKSQTFLILKEVK